MSARILVVDDDPHAREIFQEKLEHSGYEVTTAESAEDALGKVKKVDPAIIITDLRMPGMDGLALLEKVKSAMDVEVIVVTGHEDMNSAVAAMKAGAFDYIVKPVDLKQVDSLVARCLREQELNREAAARDHDRDDDDESTADAVVGKDPRMIDIYKMIGVLARNRATVMVRGETGTGKEMVARAIHANSAHADEPFIAVNCTALTDTLLESELFGHQKGSFTGAVSSRKGYFELAGSGTIFLDEIGDTSAEFQTKLLRVLQEREFRPIGGDHPVQVDFRLICATNVDLQAALADGRVREDLYFRINTITLRVPSLRERAEDIPLLCSHFFQKFNRRYNKSLKGISPAAYQLLIRFRWPGNVRELENAIERSVLVAKGTEIQPQDLPESIRDEAASTTFSVPPHHTLAEIERLTILQTLQRTNWNKQEAASILGLYRPTLYSKMRKHDIRDPRTSAVADEA